MLNAIVTNHNCQWVSTCPWRVCRDPFPRTPLVPAENIVILALLIVNTFSGKYGSWQLIWRQNKLDVIVIYRILNTNTIAATRFLHIQITGTDELTFYWRFSALLLSSKKRGTETQTHHDIKVNFNDYGLVSILLRLDEACFWKSGFFL